MTAPTFFEVNDRRISCAGRVLDLSAPHVMGILNITPDSFSDGGSLWSDAGLRLDALLRRAGDMVQAGATLLDIGGESTRPGAPVVSEAEELDRVVPAVEALCSRFDVVISLDTSTPSVMRAGAAAGAGFINDVRALLRPGALEAAAATGLPVCLMHMQGDPETMQQAPNYQDLMADVRLFLVERVEAALAVGIDRECLILDPGFGFGKTPAHNLALLNRMPELFDLKLPILAGLSRKSVIGAVLGRPVEERLAGSLSLAVAAVLRGASIIRCHDVKETVDAVRMADAVLKEAVR